MIIGIGTDLVDIRRIEENLQRHGARFEERCFTEIEQQSAENRENINQQANTYAKRFAAKEACVKALGTGFRDDITMKDIGVVPSDNGRPTLSLTGGALKQLDAITPQGMQSFIHLSLTDEPPYAQAYVIIEARAA